MKWDAKGRFLTMGLGGLALVGAGCSQKGPEEQVVIAQEPVSGYLGQVIGCNADETRRISEAVLAIRTALNSTSSLDFLKEAALDGAQHGYLDAPNWASGFPEWIIARMSENLPTNVECSDTCVSGGGALPCAANETLCLLHSFFTPTVDRAQLAGTIAHEVAHNKCMPDPIKFGTPANVWGLVDAVYRAVAYTAPFPFRSSMPQETTLAPVGLDYESAGTGLSGIDSVCSGTDVAAGFWASYTPGQGPSSMALACRPRDHDSSLTYSPEKGHRGPNGGLTLCINSTVMVGLHGHADTQVRAIGPLCVPRIAVLNKTPLPPIVKPHFGPDTGPVWKRQCPAGMVVKGFRERNDKANGSYPVTYLEVTCQTLSSSEPINISEWDGPILGAATRMFYVERCLGREVVTSLTSVSGSRSINRLGGNCYPVNGSGAGAVLDNSRTGVVIPYGDQLGVEGVAGLGATDSCAAGSALIGLNTYVDQSDAVPRVRGLQGICADFSAWNGSGAAPLTALTARGATAEGPWQEYHCPRGTYLNGWYIAEDYGLTGIKGICRSFNPAPTTVNDSLFTYSAGWNAVGVDSSYIGSDAHYTNIAGSTATYAFTGTAVKLFGDRYSNHGYGDVTLDGVYQGRIDPFDTGATGGTWALWQRDGLSSGEHNVVVTVVGAHDEFANDSHVTVDGLQYLSTGSLPLFSNVVDDFAANYAGSWSAGQVNGTFVNYGARWSNVPGNSWSYTFDGTSVQIISDRHPNHGFADVAIDGIHRGRYDGYDSVGTGGRQIVWEGKGLASGSHTITVSVVGRHNPAAIDNYVVLDGIAYQ
jgi:hypothetical protein